MLLPKRGCLGYTAVHMSRERRGEKFLPISGRYKDHPVGEGLVAERKAAVKRYDLKEALGDDTSVMTFRLGRTHHDQIDRLNGDIETHHRVNFFEHIARRLEGREQKKRFNILLLGSGVGLFNDELRAEFGNKIDVKGISLVNEGVLQKQKQSLGRHALRRTGPFEGSSLEHDQDLDPRRRRVREILDGGKGNRDQAFVPRDDAKWSSILDLHDYPEFDLIIDTFDEIFYASKDADTENLGHQFEVFDWKLRAAIRKLSPGGELFIARIEHNPKRPQYSAMRHLWEAIPELQQQEKVRVFIGGVAYEDILKGSESIAPHSRAPSFEEVLSRLELLSESRTVDGVDSRTVDSVDSRGDSRDQRFKFPPGLSLDWYRQANLGVLPIKIVRDKKAALQKPVRPVITPEALFRFSHTPSAMERVRSVGDKVLRRARILRGWIEDRWS